jgi:hypothetical protein
MIGTLFSGIRSQIESNPSTVVILYPVLALVGALMLIYGIATEMRRD